MSTQDLLTLKSFIIVFHLSSSSLPLFSPQASTLVYLVCLFYPHFIVHFYYMCISKRLMLFGVYLYLYYALTLFFFLFLCTLYFWNHSTLLYVYPAHLLWPLHRIQTCDNYSGRKILGSRKYIQTEYTFIIWKGCAKIFSKWLYIIFNHNSVRRFLSASILSNKRNYQMF